MIYWTTASRDPAELEAAAKEVLSPQEGKRMEGMRFPKRRSEWLLGRWTAKRLAVQKIPALAGLALPDFSVLNRPEGAPYLALLDGTPVSAALSISHRGDQALCAVSPESARLLGVDIELVEPRTPGFISDYFTSGEQAYAAALDVESLVVWVTAAWSLKESVFKALGTGLRADTRQVEVAFTSHPDHFDPQPPDWTEAGIQTFHLGDHVFRAYWQRMGAYVITLVSDMGADPGQLSYVELPA